MELEKLRSDLRSNVAGSELCPGCNGYGKLLRATGRYHMASHCEECDIVFGWERKMIPLPNPADQIEIDDTITAMSPAGEVVTGVVQEIEQKEFRGNMENHKARIVTDVHFSFWVDLRGAFKSAPTIQPG